ncbi:ZYRO0C13640p [Zygosaccharomyces rouxii]|uniref:ZYRO0C13640p n=1 Tax=Zygosaccharomyces rouxii (strain ATCC 2623 / CBS 732 / NBRC 1130 / NCYC 568 / NRRL Y-229) TaxID=559307 RepID=C5DU38_ZYGRC|nr:uncharacterized protein ZYRO0C13640g [Zygosaccharomyces rouxii]KAH9201525.1 hypothetical protein LQ764DRAFT_228978 [Zygosaccharomyces rouxii]CAR27299.1 ZYRO0C13640p [Zygosaccharomyces rouxii]
MSASDGLGRIFRLIAASNGNWQSVIKKIVVTYGVVAVLFLLRVRRRRYQHLFSWLRNATALSTLHLYPLLRDKKLLGSNRQLAWCIVSAAAVKYATRVPAWLPSYLTIEVISDYVMSRPSLLRLLQGLEEARLIRIRQLTLCVLVPLLYLRPNGKKWFGKSSLVRDFALFYGVWNLTSIYRYCKNLIRRKRKSSAPTLKLVAPKDEWPLVSTSLKPLMDKLTELQELTVSNKHTLFETLMDSALVKNVVPCLKWSLWRQFCIRVLSQVKLGRTQIMKSLMLMFGFLVLDHNRKMDISPQLLKYLVRCQLKEYLEKGNDFKKWLTFASLNVALYTTH